MDDYRAEAAEAICAVLCEVCTVEEVENVIATIHPDDWKRAADEALRAANYRGAVEALEDAIAAVGSGRVWSTPSSTYQPQVSVARVERWRAALGAARGR